MKLLRLILATLAIAGVAATSAAAATDAELRDKIRDRRDALQKARVADCREWRQAWRYEHVSAIPSARLEQNLAYVRRRVEAVRDAAPLCHEGLWQCVHRHEGSWTDPNPLYYGGLQMGAPFAARYGDRQSFGRNIYRQEGTPNRWSEREQIAVAEGAYRENGQSTRWLDSQWPNSPAECGGYL